MAVSAEARQRALQRVTSEPIAELEGIDPNRDLASAGFNEMVRKEKAGELKDFEKSRLEAMRARRFARAKKSLKPGGVSEFLGKAQEGDTPIFNVSPVDFQTAAMTEARVTLPSKVRFLRQQYPDSKFRVVDDKILMRVKNPKSGQEADFTVDPIGYDKNDLAGMASYMPVLALQLGMLFTPGFREKTLAAAAAGEAGIGLGASTAIDNFLNKLDEATSGMTIEQVTNETEGLAYQTEILDVMDKMGVRGTEAAIDFGFPLGLSGLGKLLSGGIGLTEKGVSKGVEKTIDFFGVGRSESNKKLMSAAELLDEKLIKAGRLATDEAGIPLPRTSFKSSIHLDEMVPVTVAPLLKSMRDFSQGLAGGGALAKKDHLRQERLADIQDLLGVTDVNTADTGAEVFTEIRKGFEGIEEAAAAARKEAEGVTLGELTEGLKGIGRAAVDPATERIRRLEVGQSMRSAARLKRNAFKEQARQLYEEAEKTIGDEKIVDASIIFEEMDALASKLSGAGSGPANDAAAAILARKRLLQEQISEEAGEILDQFGRPIDSGIAQKPATKMLTVKSARNERTALFDAMMDDAALPNLTEGVKRRLVGKWTEAIEESMKRAPEGSQEALAAANKHYKGADDFIQHGIKELFVPNGQGGFVPDEQYVKRILDFKSIGEIDITRWSAAKNFFGEGSQEFTGLRRAGLDTLLNVSGNLGNNLKSPMALAETVAKLDKVIAKDIFGDRLGFIRRLAKLEGIRNKQVPKETLDEILRTADSGKATKLLRAAIAEEDRLAEASTNRLLRDIKSGMTNDDTFTSETLITRMLTKASKQEVADVIKRISPDQRKQVEKALTKEIFVQSQRSPDELASLLKLDRKALTSIDKVRFTNLLHGDISEGVIREVLGDKVPILEAYLRLAVTQGDKAAADATAAGMAKGSILGDFVRFLLWPMRAATSAMTVASARAMSQVLAADRTMRLLTSDGPKSVKIPMTPEARRFWLSGNVFVNDFMEEFSEDEDDQRTGLGILKLLVQEQGTEENPK